MKKTKGIATIFLVIIVLAIMAVICFFVYQLYFVETEKVSAPLSPFTNQK